MLLDDFLVRSLIAGFLMVLIAAPMGCLMVWQKLAFLADTLGHAAILGVAIGLLMQWQPMLGVLLVVLLIGLSMSHFIKVNDAITESTLAIISHTGLAAGLLLLGFLPSYAVNLEAILFGDLLAVSLDDLRLIFSTVVVLLILLFWHWRDFVAITVSWQIAQAEGVAVKRVRLLLILMIALLIAVMMKVMGVLLIAAMLVIPTSAARLISSGPEQMALLAAIFGLAALFLGMYGSYQFDLMSGPAIVLAATLLLVITLLMARMLSYKKSE